jgi:hypothetical protein
MWRCFVTIGLGLVFGFTTAAAESPSREVQKLEQQLKDRDSSVRAGAALDLPGDRLVRLRGESGFRRVQARWPGRQDPKDVTRFDRFGP